MTGGGRGNDGGWGRGGSCLRRNNGWGGLALWEGDVAAFFVEAADA